MNAEIIGVGTEIILGDIANSHARVLSQELAKLGISVFYHSAVGDHMDRIVGLVQLAMSRSEVIVITGGLGPTEDDLTRNAVAKACDLPLVYDDEAFRSFIEPYFQKLGRSYLEIHRRQAERIGTAEFLPNARGTAPGQYVFINGCHLFLLPGPPLEMIGMFKDSVLSTLVKLTGQGSITSRVMHLFGIGESAAEERIIDLIQAQSNPTIAPLAGEGEMLFRITAKAENQASALALIAPVEREIFARLGDYVYGYDEDTLPSVVMNKLLQANGKVGFAESCTGGLLSSMLVDLPGASEVLAGGIVAYQNESKLTQLHVPAQTLAQYGAVSEEVAIAMAKGVRNVLGCEYGVGVTGIAGPGGGTTEKPVGLVFMAATDGQATKTVRIQVPGNRTQIRIRSAKVALKLLLDLLNYVEVKK